MQDENTDRLLELQMKELKDTYGQEQEEAAAVKVKSTAKNPKDAKVAEMYADAADYEKELEAFEAELEVINANQLTDLVSALSKEFSDEARDFSKELHAILVATWTHQVETGKSQSAEELALIQESEFSDVVEKLTSSFPDYDGDFEKEIRAVLVKRWEALVAIKKEHIKEEMDEIYIAGLKPSYVKRVYKRYYGIS